MAKIFPLLMLLMGSPLARSDRNEMELIEAAVAEVHEAFVSGVLSCEQLTRDYISRIEAYDQTTGLNSIIQMLTIHCI